MRKFILVIVGLIFAIGLHAKYQISSVGKEFIKKQENCSLIAYWDSNGYSIGYGHHGKDVKKGMRISKTQANKYFDEDIKWVEDAANRIIESLPYKYKFTQGFFDGLCSLIYNCGESGIVKSEFYNRLYRCRVKNGNMNMNDYNFTIASIKNINITHKGHKKRRYDEHILMLS